MPAQASQEVRPVPRYPLWEELAPLKTLDVFSFIGGQGQKPCKRWSHLGFQHLDLGTLILPKQRGQLNFQILLGEGIQMSRAIGRQGPGQDSAQRDKEAPQ